VKVSVKKWVLNVCAAVVVWAAVVAIVYRRKIYGEVERRSWERYYLSSATRATLDSSENFVFLSVDPRPRMLEPEFDPASNKETERARTNAAAQSHPKEYFHDHRVLGRTEIKDPKRKRELLAALYSSVEKYRGSAAACFNPRHGIVATAGTNRVELLICFECASGEEYSASGEKEFLIGKEPTDLFNRTLQEAGVPLAKK
jgi:hypothetical protein